MKTPLLVTAAYPKHEFADIAHLGIKASNLALLHQAALEPRLPPSTLSTLIDDLDALGVAIPGAQAALNQILDRAAENPEEAAELGIVKKDLEAISAEDQRR